MSMNTVLAIGIYLLVIAIIYKSDDWFKLSKKEQLEREFFKREGSVLLLNDVKKEFHKIPII